MSIGGKKKAENARIRNSNIIERDLVSAIDSRIDPTKYFSLKLFFKLFLIYLLIITVNTTFSCIIFVF